MIRPEHMPTRDDLTGDAWARLRGALADRIEHFRSMNEQDLDEVKTARVRGRIAELKELLALGSVPAPANEALRQGRAHPAPTQGDTWN